MASRVVMADHHTAWKFICDCGVKGSRRSTTAQAEQDRKAHMDRRHPKWDFSGLFRGR